MKSKTKAESKSVLLANSSSDDLEKAYAFSMRDIDCRPEQIGVLRAVAPLVLTRERAVVDAG